jgi:hypothetical protein
VTRWYFVDELIGEILVAAAAGAVTATAAAATISRGSTRRRDGDIAGFLPGRAERVPKLYQSNRAFRINCARILGGPGMPVSSEEALASCLMQVRCVR